MQCPNCQNEYQNGTSCPLCNVDSVLFSGTVRLSDKLYNKGLAKLKNGDLSQGIELLTRSVSVNKNNVNSRNLLGLALFEIGYVGDAFKHWVISQSLQKDDNPATYYVEEARKNVRALEALNDATVKYNQALTYLKQKSDDLAIIQLKRAVELNPRFIDALNLLALCYLIQNDREKAAAAAERVLAVDVQNAIALNYLSVINPGRTKPDIRKPVTRKNPGQKQAVGSIYKPVSVQEKGFRLDIILALIIGAALAFAVGYVLFVPAITRQSENQVEAYRAVAAAAEEAQENEALQHAEQMSEMRNELRALENSLEENNALFDLQNRKLLYMEAENLFRDGQLLETVNLLDDINTTGFPSHYIERIESIRETAYPSLRTYFMNEGLRAFNANDFYKALVDLELALRFMDDTPRTAEFLFALASLYAEDEARHEEALELVTELRERFPNHRPQASTQLYNRVSG